MPKNFSQEDILRVQNFYESFSKTYDLFMKQYKKSFLTGTRDTATEREYLIRMANLYSKQVDTYLKVKKLCTTPKNPASGKFEPKYDELFTAYAYFKNDNPEIDKFVKAVKEGQQLLQEQNKAYKKFIDRTIGKKPEASDSKDNGSSKYVINSERDIFNSPEDPTITAEQKKGIEEFEAWLYRNCEKTGFKVFGGGQSKRDFANEFKKLPARVKLNTLYLIENKQEKAEQTSKLVNASQKYVPTLAGIKDQIIVTKAKFWTRLKGTHLQWEKIEDAIGVAKKNEEKLLGYTYGKVAEDREKATMEASPDSLMSYNEVGASVNEVENTELEQKIDDNAKSVVNENTTHSVKITSVSSNTELKRAENTLLSGKIISYANIGRNVTTKVAGFAGAAETGLEISNGIGKGVSAVTSILQVAVDGVNLSNIDARIDAMQDTIMKNYQALDKIMLTLDKSNSLQFVDKLDKESIKDKTNLNYGVKFSFLEKITDEDIKDLSAEDKELINLAKELRAQIKIAKQDFAEARRHRPIAVAKLTNDTVKMANVGLSLIPGAQIVSVGISAVGTVGGFYLDNQNEELNRDDYRAAIDDVIDVNSRVKKAKDNLEERKENLPEEDKKRIDEVLNDDKTLKDKIRSEAVTKEYFADVREWYRADKAGQVMHLINQSKEYDNKIEKSDDLSNTTVKTEKESLIDKAKSLLKTNADKMLNALKKNTDELAQKTKEASGKKANLIDEFEIIDKADIEKADIEKADIEKEQDKEAATKDVASKKEVDREPTNFNELKEIELAEIGKEDKNDKLTKPVSHNKENEKSISVNEKK